MVWLTLALAAGLFGLGGVVERRLVSRPGRIGALLIGGIAAAPGLLFVLYYTHLFDSARWFYEFRSLRASELAACGLGFIAGTFIPRSSPAHWARGWRRRAFFWLCCWRRTRSLGSGRSIWAD